MVDFETYSSKSEVSKSNSWKITSFSKTMLLQREPFRTMFYTINSSLMLVTKSVFKLIFVLSNYQMCNFPLKKHADNIIDSCLYISCFWNVDILLFYFFYKLKFSFCKTITLETTLDQYNPFTSTPKICKSNFMKRIQTALTA